MLAVIGHRFVARQDLADDIDVLACARQGLVERSAVPTLDDLGARDAKAEDEATPREVIHGLGGHGHGHWSPGAELTQRGAEPHGRRRRPPPGQRGQGIGAIGLRCPHRVEAEAFGLRHLLDGTRRRSGSPVAELQSELEICHRVPLLC